MDFDDDHDDDDGNGDLARNEHADNDGQGLPTTILETQATFSEYMVWDHDHLPPVDNTFIKAVTEWIPFAQAVSLEPIFFQRGAWFLTDIYKIHSTDPPKQK